MKCFGFAHFANIYLRNGKGKRNVNLLALDIRSAENAMTPPTLKHKSEKKNLGQLMNRGTQTADPVNYSTQHNKISDLKINQVLI